MLKINGRPVLKLTGWHASVAVLLAGFLLSSLLGGIMGGGCAAFCFLVFFVRVCE